MGYLNFDKESELNMLKTWKDQKGYGIAYTKRVN